jgi:Uma2 family endonuclease
MGMPAASTKWTAERVRALPDDGKRYEVIDGELYVTPAPSWEHQRAALGLAYRIRSYLEGQAVAEVYLAPADIEFRFDRMVEPDLFVVPMVDGRRPRNWGEVRRLLLAVEILSPSSARADRLAKRLLYQGEQVAEYWIVDVDARLIERWRPADTRPEIIVGALEWVPAADCPPFTMDLDAYFQEVCIE